VMGGATESLARWAFFRKIEPHPAKFMEARPPMSLRNHKPKTPLFDPEAEGKSSDVLPVAEVPTIPPPFDLEGFARSQMQREEGRKAPSGMPTMPPPVSLERLRPHPPSGNDEGPFEDELDSTRSALAGKFFAGDYAGALQLAEALLATDPTDDSARDFAEECCRMLEKEYATRLGSLERVVVLQVTPAELTTLALDHHAGFLLSRVDGVSSLETLLDVCAMTRLDALRMVLRLVEEGVVALT
jgi:hypothetical protein